MNIKNVYSKQGGKVASVVEAGAINLKRMDKGSPAYTFTPIDRLANLLNASPCRGTLRHVDPEVGLTAQEQVLLLYDIKLQCLQNISEHNPAGLPVRSQGESQSDNKQMDNITIRQGETLFLSCSQGDFVTHTAWLNRSSILYAGEDKWSVDPRVSLVTLNQDEFTIKIEDVDLTDEGQYICAVQTSSRPRTTSVHIIVQAIIDRTEGMSAAVRFTDTPPKLQTADVLSSIERVSSAPVDTWAGAGGKIARCHTRMFLAIAPLTSYPLCTFYDRSLNHACSVPLSKDGPRADFTFMEWILARNGSPFTVCPDDDLASSTPDTEPSPPSPRCAELKPEPTDNRVPTVTDKPSPQGATELRITADLELLMTSVQVREPATTLPTRENAVDSESAARSSPCTMTEVADGRIVLLDPPETTQSVTIDDDEETTSAVTELESAGRPTENRLVSDFRHAFFNNLNAFFGIAFLL
ncbi:hypothetical protein cypCar_00005089 [Cyprinus carpio]|nr:hypothetical protein cypCar_00005089 [Cyprinus carpio]